MIRDRAKEILSGRASEDEERNVVFQDEGSKSFVFRLFRVCDHTGDPELQAIRWLCRARGLCRAARGELSTGIIRSKDEMSVMALVSGRDIQAIEWSQVNFDDSSRLIPYRMAP